jgi:hypothetical protein
MVTMNAPIEPRDGCAMDGDGGGFIGEDFCVNVGPADGIVASANLIVEPSATVAISRPAQPGWLSTAYGS